MANTKKLIQAAAGNAGDAALNVEQLFSTYLYDGNEGKQTINNGIALGGFGVGTSTKFNKVDSDYLSRSSDLSGNNDSNKFTFSVWLKFDALNGYRIYQVSDGSNGRFIIYPINSSTIQIKGYTSSGTTLMDGDLSYTLNTGVWYHILISIELSYTSRRKVYINDEDVSSSVTWGTYTNGSIDFTNSIHEISTDRHGGSYYDGNMAHLFLDYTYRDLDTTSNRRLFIDANGGSTSPSTLSALNPILYLPMTDGYSIGENLGTGGDFTSNNSPTIVSEGTEYDADVAEGGMVWVKARSNGAYDHYVSDTERGTLKYVKPNGTDQEGSSSNGISAFNRNGFTIGGGGQLNNGTDEYVSWTWRKAENFFDCVTFTGNGTAGRTVSHNLGTTPAMIIVKGISNAGNWAVYHRGITDTPETKYMNLNSSAGFTSSSSRWNNTAPTDTEFTVGDDTDVNGNGYTYVAYLFAHHDGDGTFGPDGDADIIKCDSYTGNGSDQEINLGFEPQWILFKSQSTHEWAIMDTMRGLFAYNGTDTNNAILQSTDPNAESVGFDGVSVTPTGFKLHGASNVANNSGTDYIYTAIRSGPMAVPEDATDVFQIKLRSGTAADASIENNIITDAVYLKPRNQADEWVLYDRLRGSGHYLYTHAADNEQGSAGAGDGLKFNKQQTGYEVGNLLRINASGANYVDYAWKRAPEFFDITAYDGTGSTTTQNVNHNLGVVPEMIWVKDRDGVTDWFVYHKDVGKNKYLIVNGNDAETTSTSHWNDTLPTNTRFTVGQTNDTNSSSGVYIAYLFASVAGVSKVGSFSYTYPSDLTVDCGFTSGPRFLMIKKTSATGGWIVIDTERGFTSGNDPWLQFNTVNTENTSWDIADITPTGSGFIIPSNGLLGSGDYIFYAIA